MLRLSLLALAALVVAAQVNDCVSKHRLVQNDWCQFNCNSEIPNCPADTCSCKSTELLQQPDGLGKTERKSSGRRAAGYNGKMHLFGSNDGKMTKHAKKMFKLFYALLCSDKTSNDKSGSVRSEANATNADFM